MLKKRLTAGFVAFALLVSSACLTGTPGDTRAAESAETIASLNYSMTNSHTDAETDGTLSKTKYGTKKGGYKFSTGNALLFASINGSDKRKLEWSKEQYKDAFANNSLSKQPVMTAGKKNPWKSGSTPYFEIQLSTAGYKNISFSAYVGATKKGPKSYRLTCAIGDNGTFSPISGAAMNLSDNKVTTKIGASLPEAANNQKMVKIRIEITSLTSLGGEDMTSVLNNTGGEVSINHIIVSGVKADTTTATGSSSGDSTSVSSSSSGNKADKATMKVKKISLSKKATVKKNKKLKLKVTVKVTPQTKANVKAVKSKLKWTSSNKKVATVSKDGKVKAKKKGKTTITVKYSKKIKATCKVTVK